MGFPDAFVWGAAASSYQIEGGATQDGRGPSIWDTFCKRPGAVWEGHSGDVACDHYNRWREDVAIMKQMGLKAYRLSVCWPRVMPDGTGAVNTKGLDFYSALVDELLKNGIEPYVTLFHWDYPEALNARGGWLERDSAAWFAEYSKVVVERLSDRVTQWMTLNEPQVFIKFGHGDGINAPGLRLPMSEQLLAAHHALLAHGMSTQAIRAAAKRKTKVGWAPVCVVKYPRGAADVEAARAWTFGVRGRDLWNNAWWYEPVMRGEYPAEGLAVYGADAPKVRAGDMETMCQPLDYIGLNIYEGQPVVASGNDGSMKVEQARRSVGHALTAFRWPVEPESLYWGPRFVWERYKVPVYITENGLSNIDWVSLDGAVHDPQRIDFTQRYLRCLKRACTDGVDVRGYFHWSLMDNFEWAAGYKERFGLVYVDFETGRRVPKDSAAWYRGVIERNGTNIGEAGPLFPVPAAP